MKKFYTFSLILSVILYIGCGSAEVGVSGSYMISNNLDTTNYTTKRDFNHHLKTDYISSLSTEGEAVDIVISKDANIAYIASGNGGLEVVDISNPKYPSLIKSYNLDQYINHVELKGNKIYASYTTQDTSPYQYMSIFDISNPYNPIYQGSYESRSSVAHYRVRYGDYILEVDDDGLKIYLDDKLNGYIEVASHTLGDHAYALAVNNGYLYIANGRDGLVILKTDLNSGVGRFIE